MSDDGEIKAWWEEEIARLERELAAAQAEIAALLKTKMTLAELGNMIEDKE